MQFQMMETFDRNIGVFYLIKLLSNWSEFESIEITIASFVELI